MHRLSPSLLDIVLNIRIKWRPKKIPSCRRTVNTVGLIWKKGTWKVKKTRQQKGKAAHWSKAQGQNHLGAASRKKNKKKPECSWPCPGPDMNSVKCKQTNAQNVLKHFNMLTESECKIYTPDLLRKIFSNFFFMLVLSIGHHNFSYQTRIKHSHCVTLFQKSHQWQRGTWKRSNCTPVYNCFFI